MRTVAVAASFLLAGAAVAADSSDFQLRDAGDLVRICSVMPDDPLYPNAVGFCHGVLTGAFRYYEATVSGSSRFVCAPTPTPTRSKVMNDFVKWAGVHPANMKDPPIDTLFRFLEEAYPCRGAAAK